MFRRLLVTAALCLAGAPQLGLCQSGAEPAWAPHRPAHRAPVPSSGLPAPVVNDAVWKPQRNLTWQLQFATSPVDLRVNADVYKIDLFDNEAAAVTALQEKGKKVVC